MLPEIFSGQKLTKNAQKLHFGEFLKNILKDILSGEKLIKSAKNGQKNSETCSQTVLPDRSILKGQKLVENAKIEKLKCDIFGDFQTLCKSLSSGT